MKIEEATVNWDIWGKVDPLWVILTNPGKEEGKWDIDEFFKTGFDQITEVIEMIMANGWLTQKKRALDFGCGVGRLTQALSYYFEECHGVDVAPSMIEHARKFNLYVHKCHYSLNLKDDLTLFPDNYFDFIYSALTLQHIHPEYTKKYIKEFIRILSPSGLLMFQLPSEHMTHSSRTIPLHEKKSWTPQEGPVIEMYAISKEEIYQIVEGAGAEILHMQLDEAAGEMWLSMTYTVTK